MAACVLKLVCTVSIHVSPRIHMLPNPFHHGSRSLFSFVGNSVRLRFKLDQYVRVSTLVEVAFVAPGPAALVAVERRDEGVSRPASSDPLAIRTGRVS